MTVEDARLREQLTAFGFSDKEVDTYVALLGHGEAKASAIAESAGVSKRYVYNVLGSFEERGFVEINDHETPTTIRAVEPSKVVSEFADTLESMEKRLESQYDPAPDTDREYDVLKSTSTVRKRVRELVSDARDEINLSIPASLVPQVADRLRAARERGVLTIVQVNEDGSGTVDRSELEGLGNVVRYWDARGPLLATVDRQYGLFAPGEVVSGGETDQQAISFTEDRLSPVVVGSFLGNYWPAAEEVYVHEPREPPQTYDRFRHAVLDASLHMRRGRSLVAELDISPTGGREERRTTRGAITDVSQGLVEPTSNSLPIEHSFVVDDGEETFSVGGPGAFEEEYEAHRVRLDVVDDGGPSVTELIDRSSRLRPDGDGS